MTMTELAAPAARAVNAVKTYGSGDTTVQALDGVTVDFPMHQFTAIMGPSGSGKSTLMQCVAGLDRLTSGSAFVGDTELSTLNKTELTLLRRDRLGFIFQQYNLIPTLSAKENILLPLTLAGADEDEAWFDTIVDTVGLAQSARQPAESAVRRSAAARRRRPGARARSPTSSSPTNRPATSTRAPAWRSSRSCATPSTSPARPSSWSPTTPTPRRTPNSVLFLADGQIVDEMPNPTTDRVLDRMKRFES